MMATRIKRRPVLFTIWLVSSSLLLSSIATFVKGIGYFGDTKQLMFMSGGLLVQDAPVQGAEMGLKSFDVEMPDRGIWMRIQGFFMYPQRIGSALWVPFGSTLLILVTFVSWRYWRMLEPPP